MHVTPSTPPFPPPKKKRRKKNLRSLLKSTWNFYYWVAGRKPLWQLWGWRTLSINWSIHSQWSILPVVGWDRSAVLTWSGLPTYLVTSFGTLGVFLTSSPRAETALWARIAPNLWELCRRKMRWKAYQSISLQEGKPGAESPWPNFNLTDNFKNQNQRLGI